MALVFAHLHADSTAATAPAPLLRPGAAALIAVGLTSTYVLSLYWSTSTRVGSKAAYYNTTITESVRVRRRRRRSSSSSEDKHDEDDEYEEVEEIQTREVLVPLDKNHPKVVAARLKVAAASTIGAVAVTAGVLNSYASPRLFHSWMLKLPALSTYFGLPLPVPTLLTSSALPFAPPLTSLLIKHYLPAMTLPLGLTAALFLGPLFETWLDGELLPGQREWSWQASVASKYDNIWAVRNFIVGPLSEELVFRACILNLHHASHMSTRALIFLTPLYFGVAHLHHAWEAYVKGGRTRQALIRGLLQSTFQLAYTTIFGWYANLLFLRTNSILAPTLCHSFCNMMGFPDPAGAMERHPKRKRAIIASYIVGIATFAYSLWRATDPALYGGSLFYQ